ncbi:MAG TPA: ABC transporter ATP-binding protein [Pseudonocardiaceae bacterium]|jgi:ABC-type multidrug transport system ATPase subunit|nr:ABC transporter ATP-binding protein [Pseudonocardiaceae bacterium]
MLTVSGLVRAFGGLTVLDGVSFTLDAGEAGAVIGPNGSGKSTLLRCVVGADLPDTGTVRLAGRSVDETSPAVRAMIAAALDDVDFFPDLSVVEHLSLCSWLHGADSPDEAVDSVLDDLGLVDARDQLPATLSTGQRQRLALASCFVRPHTLLVLDEPEQRLDTAGRAWLIEKITVEKRAGVAVLFASHDPELIDAVADQVITVGPG